MSGQDGRTSGLRLIPAILAALILRRSRALPGQRPAATDEAPAGPGYETSDVDAGRTALVMAALAVSALVAVASMVWLMAHVAAGQRRDRPAFTPQQTARLKPPPPNLQADPYADLARERAAEAARLDAYGYADAARQRAHIPIDRAMTLSVGRSLDP